MNFFKKYLTGVVQYSNHNDGNLQLKVKQQHYAVQNLLSVSAEKINIKGNEKYTDMGSDLQSKSLTDDDEDAPPVS